MNNIQNSNIRIDLNEAIRINNEDKAISSINRPTGKFISPQAELKSNTIRKFISGKELSEMEQTLFNNMDIKEKALLAASYSRLETSILAEFLNSNQYEELLKASIEKISFDLQQAQQSKKGR